MVVRIREAVIADAGNNHTLKVENIQFRYKNGQIVSLGMKLDSYKHHNDSSCWLVINYISQETTCPVLALYKYWSIRPKKSGIFLILYDVQPLFRSDFVKCLRDVLGSRGMDPSTYNTHSLRIGRMTDLALARVSHERICLKGRWSSDTYLKYIRPATLVIS